MSKMNGLLSLCQSYGSYKPVNGISNISIILKDIEDTLSRDTGIVDIFHDSFVCHQGNFQVIKIKFKVIIDGPKNKKFELLCMTTFPPSFPLSHPIFSIFKLVDKRMYPIPQLIPFILPDSSFEIKVPSAQIWHQTFNFRQMLLEFYSILSRIFPFYENSKGPVLNPPQFYEYSHNVITPSIQSSYLITQSTNPYILCVPSKDKLQISQPITSFQLQSIKDSLNQQTHLINQKIKTITLSNLQSLQFNISLKSQLSEIQRLINQLDLVTSSNQKETEKLNSVIGQFRIKNLTDHIKLDQFTETKQKLRAKHIALMKISEKNISLHENKNKTFGFNQDSIGRLSSTMRMLWEQEFDCILASKINSGELN